MTKLKKILIGSVAALFLAALGLFTYVNMADEDLVVIVSYLRSGEPVRNEVPGPR